MDDRSELVALDPRSLKIEPLVEIDLAFTPLAHAWLSDMSEGLVSMSSDICAGIALIDGTGIHPWRLEIGQGNQRFRVDSEFFQPAEDCAPTGRADWPAISSSDVVAFFGSPASVGVEGHARLAVPWTLYVLTGLDAAPKKMPFQVESPRSLAWDSDGRRLAFSGTVLGRGAGVWVMDWPSGELHRADTALAEWLAWSPGGDRLAALIFPKDSSEREGRLLVLSGV